MTHLRRRHPPKNVWERCGCNNIWDTDKSNKATVFYCWNSDVSSSCSRVCNTIIINYTTGSRNVFWVHCISVLLIFFITFYSVLLLLRCDIIDDNLYCVNRELVQVVIIQKYFLTPRYHGDCSTKNKHCLQRDEWRYERGILQAKANKITEIRMEMIWKENSLSFCQQAFEMQVSESWSHSSMSQ